MKRPLRKSSRHQKNKNVYSPRNDADHPPFLLANGFEISKNDVYRIKHQTIFSRKYSFFPSTQRNIICCEIGFLILGILTNKMQNKGKTREKGAYLPIWLQELKDVERNSLLLLLLLQSWWLHGGDFGCRMKSLVLNESTEGANVPALIKAHDSANTIF